MSRSRSALLACLLAFPAAASAQSARVQRLAADGPLRFEANRGQTDSRVRFFTRGPGYGVFLTGDEAVVDLGDVAVRQRLAGARAARSISGVETLATRSHYLKGRDATRWITDVPTFAKVRYEGVYPGVDVIYYGTGGHLEYDFVVAPGADPRRIRLKLTGVERVRVDRAGDLVMRVQGREIRQRAPIAFQESRGVRRAVEAGYLVGPGGDVRFRLGAYDPALTLTIDPVLVYSTYLGGSSELLGVSAIAAAADGSVYVGGTTNSADFPTTPGAPRRTTNGCVSQPEVVCDGYLTKLDAAGGLVYSTFIGGHGSTGLTRIAVDAAGALYLAGTSAAPDFPTTAGAYQAGCAALDGFCNSGFVAKLDSTGSGFVFSTYLGNAYDASTYYGTVIAGLAVDDQHNLFVTGLTGAGFPVTPGAYQTVFQARPRLYHAFATKLNATGSDLVYSTYLGGTQYDYGRAIGVDAEGNAYVAGLANSADFPTTPGAFQRTCPIVEQLGGCNIAFVSKIDSTGTSLIYSTLLGGSGPPISALNGLSSDLYDLAVDAAGFAYVTGWAHTTDFPTTPGSAKPTTTTRDAFVTKLNQQGSALVYSTFVGGDAGDAFLGAGFEEGYRIAIDAEGSAYVVGSTGSSDFPAVEAVQPVFGEGVRDAYVAKLNPAGSAFTFASYLGGSGYEQGYVIATDPRGDIYVGGNTMSADFPVVSAAQPRFPGTPAIHRPGFVARIGEPTCGVDTTASVEVFQSAFLPLLWPFTLQLVIVRNPAATPLQGPLAYAMDDLRNAAFVSSSRRTRCFSAEGDPMTLVPLGDDARLAPGEAVLLPLWFVQTRLAAIGYVPRLLSAYGGK